MYAVVTLQRNYLSDPEPLSGCICDGSNSWLWKVTRQSPSPTYRYNALRMYDYVFLLLLYNFTACCPVLSTNNKVVVYIQCMGYIHSSFLLASRYSTEVVTYSKYLQ